MFFDAALQSGVVRDPALVRRMRGFRCSRPWIG